MLETVKSYIQNSPCISFGQYFTEYIMKVQDANIDAEVSFLFRNNFMSALVLNRQIDEELGAMIW